MLFEIISDIHLDGFLEFHGDFFVPKTETLVLLGDICQVDQIDRQLGFFEKINKAWKRVFYIMGNHEFYNGFIGSAASIIKQKLRHLKNIVILDDEVIKVDCILFIGSTLWTDMMGCDPMAKLACKRGISDYNYIFTGKSLSVSSKPISPDDTYKLFIKHYDFLQRNVLTTNEPVVILTHHAPSFKSVNTQFKGSILNAAFVNELDDFILFNKHIKVWCHGHTHGTFDYMIEHCRVVCHAKGYRGESLHIYNYRPKVIEV